jgi:hypothetical protein
VPIPSFSDCDPDDYVCCTTLYDVAQRTHDVLFAALLGCLPAQECQKMSGYIMTGPPQDPVGDYLALNAGVNQTLQATKLPLPRASFAVQLMETGWPMIDGDLLPSAAELAFASQHSYGHAEVVVRALYRAMAKGTLPGGSCTFQQMGTMVPLARSGGMAGWRIDFTIGIEW